MSDGIASQSDEIRDLLGLDAVALADLGGPDARDLADTADGLEDRDVVRDELERVPVGRRDERGTAASSLGGDRGAEEVVRLESRRLAADDPRRLEEPRREIELLEQLRVELPAGLVAGQELVAVGRDEERVPADDHRPRLLGLPEAEQHVGEAGEQVPGLAVRAPDRPRQRMEGPVRERVAVDDEQRCKGRGFSRVHFRRALTSASREMWLHLVR